MVNLFSRQEDPDGELGHKERERWTKEPKKYVKSKGKFVGSSKKRIIYSMNSTSLPRLEKEIKKEHIMSCKNYKWGCSMDACTRCKHNKR
jgi:hypothetical protein